MNKLVYSSEKNVSPQKSEPKTRNVEGPIKVRIEKKGRGGKSVTVVFNLPFTDAEAKSIKKELSSALGAGSTYKAGRIEVQGDHVEKVISFFSNKSMKALKAGG